MEGLLEASPRHEGLLLAAPRAASCQYAYGWVQHGGRHRRGEGPRARHGAARAGAQALPAGARLRPARARGRLPGLRARRSRATPRRRSRRTKKEHVPLLYWTAWSWAAAMALKVNDSDAERRPADRRGARHDARARARRGLRARLDPRVLHQLGGRRARRSAARSTRAREHFERASRCAHGRRAFPYVTFAESVERRQAGQGAVPGAAGEGARRRREPARRPAPRQPARPEARALAARRALDELFIE